MTENNAFLEGVQEDLKKIVQPYQSELNQKQKKADFIRQCIRSAGKDDFLSLDEMLKTKLSDEVRSDQMLEGCGPALDALKNYAGEKVEFYRIQLIEDLTRRCSEVDLEIGVDFPKFSVLKGISGEIDFAGRCTTINKKVLKSIDPRRIVTALQQLKRRLYDRPYDPQQFIDSLYQVYCEMLDREKLKPGDPVSIQPFYLSYVISLQTKAFFQDMDKGKFKGYGLDQFSVDIYRYFQTGIGGTSTGYELRLSPGRNKSLWLLDSLGEARQITGISFHRQQG